jgi:hypothetical protein
VVHGYGGGAKAGGHWGKASYFSGFGNQTRCRENENLEQTNQSLVTPANIILPFNKVSKNGSLLE